MNEKKIIEKCFEIHSREFNGSLKFTLEQYQNFWVNHKVGDVYKLKHRNGRTELCKVAYYPLPYHEDLRALVELEMVDGVDLRDIPICFLEKQHPLP